MLTAWYFGDSLSTWALAGEFILVALVVILAGARLTRLADLLANRLNLGSGWVGLILLATVTSLPEVVSGCTATAIGNPGMALAALFGSCSFNLTLIVWLNVLIGGGSVLRDVDRSHVLTSSFGLLLIGVALLGVVLGHKFVARPAVAQVCEYAWAATILIGYLGCMRLTYRFDRRCNPRDESRRRQPFGRWRYGQLVIMAVVIVMASWWLARICDVLSTHEIGWLGRPLGASFVGAGLLALATSLPEITTSIAAVRLGNLNLALGNIFGSNMFNMFVIPMLKVTSLAKGEPLLMGAGGFDPTQNVIAGLTAILLTAITLGGLTYQSSVKMFRRFGFDSILIAVTYIGGMILLVMSAG